MSELHQAKRLAVALGVGHAEVALEALLGVASPLVADDHDRLAVETRPAGDDRRVLAIEAIAVQLDEVGEGELQVVDRERAPGVARHLHALQRGQVAVDLRPQLAELPLERRDLLDHAELPVAGEPLQLVDLLLELDDRLLEFHGCRSSHRCSPGQVRRDGATAGRGMRDV